MKCIIGLGNPGKDYRKTRHNVGFSVIDVLLEEEKISTQSKFKSDLALTNINGVPVVLIKAKTYMNLSGEALRSVMDYYKIKAEDVLVVYDDLDLPVGKFRLREKGGAGGHNGMKSIIQHLNTQEFPRLRIGIHKNPLIPKSDYVLGKFTKEELLELKPAFERAAKCCRDFMTMDFVDLMTKYNTVE